MCLAVPGFLVGFVIPINAQVLWPLAMLLLGVACGTAAFAQEQRDSSYLFLSAQHFPLRAVWRFKIVFGWRPPGGSRRCMVTGRLLNISLIGLRRQAHPSRGPCLASWGRSFLSASGLSTVSAAGNFWCGSVAKPSSPCWSRFLAGLAGLGLWLPSLLCGGMGGWQLWTLPLTLLLASTCLMRAWSSGRIWERRPLAALVGFGATAVALALLHNVYRACEFPDVGTAARRGGLSRRTAERQADNPAARAIQQAVANIDDPRGNWQASITEAARLPIGVLERPHSDGPLPLVKDLPAYEAIVARLLNAAPACVPGPLGPVPGNEKTLDRVGEVLARVEEPA